MKTNLHTNPIPGFTSVNAPERKALGIKAGDTIKVHQKIKEKGKKGERIRIQVFEGLVLASKHGSEPGATFTVRKVSNGIGIERIFPLYSPAIDKIEIVKRAKVRRAKLYHIREKVAKEIKRAMRRAAFVNTSTLSDAEYQEEQEQARVAAQEAEAQVAEAAEAQAQAELTGEEVVEEPQAEQAVEEATSQEAPQEPVVEEDKEAVAEESIDRAESSESEESEKEEENKDN
ncbi:MAG: 50S ribosomal protein L19 [Patescibacteria group bacterium]